MNRVAAQPAGTALVRHAPTLNGNVDGSIHQMLSENITLNGSARITGDLLVPGTPTVRLNGHPSYGGTIDGAGNPAPTNRTITLNGYASLRHVIRRADPLPIPNVATPPQPTGTRSVSINIASQSPGDFTTLRHLTLNSNVGHRAVPPGTYGNFIANGNSGFILGVAGSTVPSHYSFQNLTLNGNSALHVAGPVIVTVNGGFSTNGSMGTEGHSDWLTLRIAGGGFGLNGNVTVHAHVEAPSGTVTLNGNSQLIGAVASDRLIVNGNSWLRLLTAPPVNRPPMVKLINPADGASYPAPATFTLVANAADADGAIAKVEFFLGATKLGEDDSSPYEFPLSGLGAGGHAFSARATDNLGATAESAAVAITVYPSNQPPVVELIAPPTGSTYAAPASFTLIASASDAENAITKVEFYREATLYGTDTAPPYQFDVTALGIGDHDFHARVYDGQTATDSPTLTIRVVAGTNRPPLIDLVQPINGAIFNVPATIDILASASDPDGSVTRVEFFRGETKIGETTAPPFAFAWTGMLPGSYRLSARAYDNSGAVSDSAPASITVQVTLPYVTGFQPEEGYAPGSLEGQGGWGVSGDAAIVDMAGASVLTLARQFPTTEVLRGFPSYSGRSVVFTDIFVKPVFGSPPLLCVRTHTAAVGFIQIGDKGEIQILDGDGAGGGSWRDTGRRFELNASGQSVDWVRVTLREDFAAKQTDLYVDGVLAGIASGFLDGSALFFSTITLRGVSHADVSFDDLYIGFENPLFADVDYDGMNDAWEAAHGLSLTANDRHADPDSDGLANVREFQLGTIANLADTDGDGADDGAEVEQGRNPLRGTVPDMNGAVNLRVYSPSR